MEPQLVEGKKVCSPHLVYMTKMPIMPLHGKNPLKIVFGIKGPVTLGLGMQHWGHSPNKVWKMINLDWPWPFLTEKVKLFYMGSHRGKLLRPSETRRPTGPIKAEFHIELPWARGTKVCLPHLGHMIKIVDMPICGKTPEKASSPKQKGQWPWYAALGT